MLGTRHEEYSQLNSGLPFVLGADIERNRYNLSRENNWHENLEIQLCTKGSGTVFLDGKKYSLCRGDIAVVNSNVIHYTGTDKELVYDCLIIGTDFCKQMDFSLESLLFDPIVKDETVFKKLNELKKLYFDVSVSYRIVKLNKLLLEILLLLAQKHSTPKIDFVEKSKSYERVKRAVLYIRDNYQRRITLDEVAKYVICDKFTLCKDFKKHTGQTVFENLNNLRCIKAIDFIEKGHTVSEAASLCGFDNLSFFTKTFKKYIGVLPSMYKK